MPPVAAELCQTMPPPQSFSGPFVIVDKLLEVFAKTDIPDEFPGISLLHLTLT
jgi:cleavage stimulation factor subunit 3